MDELLQTVRDAAAGEFEVYGELGREGPDSIWYLARGVADQKLVALRLHLVPSAVGAKPEYDLEVAQELNAAVAVGLGDCPKCKTPIRRWMRFCTQCGADLGLGGQLPTTATDRAVMLEVVRTAAASEYDVLGEMPWTGGGIVYFALEKSGGRLVRLRLKASDGGYELGLTRALLPLAERISAAYVTSVHEPMASPAQETPAAQPQAVIGFPPDKSAPRRPPRQTVVILGVEVEPKLALNVALAVIVVETVAILFLLSR